MHRPILLAGFRTLPSQPCIYLAGCEALSDETADDAGDGRAIERSRVGTFQTPLDCVLEQGALVDLVEDFVHGGLGGRGTNPKLLHVLQHPAPAPAFDGRFESRRRERDPPIVERAIPGQTPDRLVDVVRLELAAGEAVPQLLA